METSSALAHDEARKQIVLKVMKAAMSAGSQVVLVIASVVGIAQLSGADLSSFFSAAYAPFFAALNSIGLGYLRHTMLQIIKNKGDISNKEILEAIHRMPKDADLSQLLSNNIFQEQTERVFRELDIIGYLIQKSEADIIRTILAESLSS